MDPDAEDSTSFPAATLAWGVVGVVVCGAMVPLEPNMLEEGLILEIAQRILRGDRLYQDVVAFTGPLPFEGLALLFRIFGEEIFVARAAVAALHGGAAAGTFALARAARRDGLEHVAAAFWAFAPVLLFPLYSTYFYTTLAVSIGVLASWAALRGLRDARWAIVAGLLVAAAALCKQTIGAVLAAGLFVCFLTCTASDLRRRTSAGLVGGGVIAAVITFAAFAVTGGVGALVHALIELPLSFQSTYDSPLVNFWPPGVFSEEIRESQIFYLPYYFSLFFNLFEQPGWLTTAFTQLLYALPFIAIITTLVRRRHGPMPSAVWIHFATLLAMSSNLFPRTDWGHLVAALPSAAIQLTLVAPTLPDSRRRPVPVGLAGFLAVVSLALGTTLYWISDEPRFGPRVPLRAVNSGYRGESMPKAIAYLRKNTEPGDTIFVARAEPLLYFATDTRNPTPYGGVIPGMAEEQQIVINEALETTRYVVMTDIDQPIFTYYRDELPAVQATLERYYRIPEDYLGDGTHWVQVLERGPDRGATHVDLIDRLPFGRTWIQAPDTRLKWAAHYGGKIATAQNRRFLPYLVSARGGGIDFDVEIPDNAVFQADLGFPAAFGSDRLYRHLMAARMIFSVREGDEFRVLGQRDLNPKKDDIRRWTPFEVDLAEYAGRSVTIRLEMLTSWPIKGYQLAWWGSPRIAIRPETDGAR